MPGVQTVTVEADEADSRVDRWLRRRFPQLTQGRIEKMLRKGELRVDGARAKASTRLEAGQSVRVPPIPVELLEAEKPAPRAEISAADARMIQDCVIFRDDHVIALNKPAGLPVQGGSGQGMRHVVGLASALGTPSSAAPILSVNSSTRVYTRGRRGGRQPHTPAGNPA